MLTVLMATKDRARILRAVLEAYCQIDEPLGGWKLVVVDNGSTDNSGEVVVSFRGRLPIHLVVEPQLGKNHALNTGLELVEGDLVVFTDDDAFPHSDWLTRLREAADTHLEYSMFGGAILPRWEIAPPHWIEWVQQGPVFTLTESSREKGPIAPNWIFGPNMAIRAAVFQSGVRFDPSIGPKGSDYPMGSETELLLRLGRQGYRAWYVPDATVEHLIRKDQIKKPWVFKRAIRYGRGFYRLFYSDETFKGRLWMGVPRHLFRDIPKEGILVLWAWASGKQEALFRSRWDFNFLRGQAIAARANLRSQPMSGNSSPQKRVIPSSESAGRQL
jgi:glycosyltransferase involved in cell wall biosynthesis